MVQIHQIILLVLQMLLVLVRQVLLLLRLLVVRHLGLLGQTVLHLLRRHRRRSLQH